jgi:excisionase family DNA binding protein
MVIEMGAARKLGPRPDLRVHAPVDDLDRLYDQFLGKTGSPEAAATLVLATVQAAQHSGGESEAMSIKQAAKQLGVSKGVLYRLCQEGMPHNKIGRRITITPAQIEEYRALSQQRPEELRYV